MIRQMGEGEIIGVTLMDEMGTGDKVEVTVRKGVYGLWIEFPDSEDGRGVMLDLFDGELSVKVWADTDNEDFTHKVPL